MKELELEESGFWYNIYTMTFSDLYLPESTCGYMAKLFIAFPIALILLPFSLIRFLTRYVVAKFDFISDGFTDAFIGFQGYIVQISLFILPILFGVLFIGEKGVTYGLSDLWYFWSIGFLSMIIGVILFIVFLYILLSTIKFINSIGSYQEGELTGFRAVLHSWKNKYCKKIKWNEKG